MGQFLTKMYDSQNKLVFEPIKRLHLYTDNTTEKVSYNNVYFGSIKEIRLLALVVILIVVLAIINYINNSTARAISRAKEVGVRKIGGATRTINSSFPNRSLYNYFSGYVFGSRYCQNSTSSV